MAKQRRGRTTGDVPAIRRSLLSIAETVVAAIEMLANASPIPSAAASRQPPSRAPRPPLSAVRRAALQLQGRYLGLQPAIHLAAKLASR